MNPRQRRALEGWALSIYLYLAVWIISMTAVAMYHLALWLGLIQ